MAPEMLLKFKYNKRLYLTSRGKGQVKSGIEIIEVNLVQEQIFGLIYEAIKRFLFLSFLY